MIGSFPVYLIDFDFDKHEVDTILEFYNKLFFFFALFNCFFEKRTNSELLLFCTSLSWVKVRLKHIDERIVRKFRSENEKLSLQ